MEWLAWAAVTVGLCWYQLWARRNVAHLVFCCTEAREAYRHKELYWSAVVSGWALTTVPLRTQTSAAKWYAIERGVEDCTGTPYRFDACPFCRAEQLPHSHALPSDDDTKEKGEGAES